MKKSEEFNNLQRDKITNFEEEKKKVHINFVFEREKVLRCIDNTDF